MVCLSLALGSGFSKPVDYSDFEMSPLEMVQCRVGGGLHERHIVLRVLRAPSPNLTGGGVDNRRPFSLTMAWSSERSCDDQVYRAQY